MEEEKTRVVFRRWKERYEWGDVIALFPDIPGSCITPALCSSYTHVGQHGSADIPTMLQKTAPADLSEDDVRELYDELKSLGYKNIQVFKRIPSNASTIRNDSWSEMMVDPNETGEKN